MNYIDNRNLFRLMCETFKDPNKELAVALVSGIIVETEHTNPEIAKALRSIPRDALILAVNTALDHLDENPTYYTKLKQAGL